MICPHCSSSTDESQDRCAHCQKPIQEASNTPIKCDDTEDKDNTEYKHEYDDEENEEELFKKAFLKGKDLPIYYWVDEILSLLKTAPNYPP